MFKVLWLLKPAAGVSREQFRDWYENRHVPLALQHFGHLLQGYRRNYVDDVRGAVPSDYVVGVDPMSKEEALARADRFDYAVVAEWVFANEDAFEEVMRIFTDPQVGPIFRADSNGMMHTDTVMIKVSAFESNLPVGPPAEGLT